MHRRLLKERLALSLSDDAEERAMLDDDDESLASTANSSQWALLGYYLLLSSLIAGANGMASAALNYVNMQVRNAPR